MEKEEKIPVYEIYYDFKPEKAYLKTTGKSLIKLVPTKKGTHQIITKLKNILKKKGYVYDKTYFRIFNSARMNNLLTYGSDRADHLNKRNFDPIEWELYPFRLYWDYFFTNKNREFLIYEKGPLLKNSNIKTIQEFWKKGKIRNVYSMLPDKDVVKYYNEIVKKYKRYKRDDGSVYHKLYTQMLRVKEEFKKGENAWQPEFMLTEKMAMKKYKLMRDDVTFAYKPKDGQGMDYILQNAIKKRVPSKVAALVAYKDLMSILPRVTRGGYDETALYTFKYDRIKHVIALFLLIPKE